VNAILRAQNAYGLSNRSVRTPRDAEYETIARVTQNLKSAAALAPLDMAKVARAINENRELWTLFATQVADADNSLPTQLRARIFYLAEFTSAHSRKVLARAANVDALVEINTAVMRGLRDGRVSK
jgi:flagellar protein FlaF